MFKVYKTHVSSEVYTINTIYTYIYKSYRIQVVQRRETSHISLLYKVRYKGLQIG